MSGKYPVDNFHNAFAQFLTTGTFNLEQITTHFYSKRNYVKMEIAYCPNCYKGETEVSYFYKGLFRYEKLVNEEEHIPRLMRRSLEKW